MFKSLLLVVCVLAVRADESPLEQWNKNTEEFVKSFSAQVTAITNGENTDKLKATLKESSDTILKQVSALSTSVQAAVADADGRAREALQKAQAELEKARSELATNDHGVQKSAEELRAGLKSAVSSALGPVRALADELAAGVQKAGDQLAPRVREAYDQFVAQAQEVQTKLHAAANHQ